MIEFWTHRDLYYEFSNFYMRRDGSPLFVLHGMNWLTSEHYYQAMKFQSHDVIQIAENCITVREFVAKAKTPKLAKECAYLPQLKMYLSDDWDRHKEGVMLDALLAKFSQNADLKQMLISTGDAILIEKSTKDSYWGTGADRKGRNRLGVMLMRTRWILANDNEWMLELAGKHFANNPYNDYEWKNEYLWSPNA